MHFTHGSYFTMFSRGELDSSPENTWSKRVRTILHSGRDFFPGEYPVLPSPYPPENPTTWSIVVQSGKRRNKKRRNIDSLNHYIYIYKQKKTCTAFATQAKRGPKSTHHPNPMALQPPDFFPFSQLMTKHPSAAYPHFDCRHFDHKLPGFRNYLSTHKYPHDVATNEPPP